MYRMRRRSRLISHDEVLQVLQEGSPEGGEIVIVDGKPIKREFRIVRIRCTVQPMGARELLLSPEGDRDKEQLSVWTYSQAVAVNDKVLRLGKLYNIRALEDWGSYRKASLIEVDVGPSILDVFDAEEGGCRPELPEPRCGPFAHE